MKKLSILFCASILCLKGFGQENSSPFFSWSGYIETYYVYDFNKPEDSNRPPFVYSFNRHNEVNVNLGFLKGTYSSESLRANMAIMTGTYANANLAQEPGVLRNIFEANVGVKLSSNKNLWVDAGIFASHIGFESAIGKDSWNLTRSILADNTPYFESGVKVSYTSDNEKWFVAGLFLNGWQRIHRQPGNSLPSFGTQVTYKPTDKVLINSSTFIGTDSPDSARLMRYFHNLYAILQVSNKIGFTVGIDNGFQHAAPKSSSYNSWFSAIVIARLTINDKASMDFRAEYYDDEGGVIIPTGTPNGFKTTNLSSNFDVKISSHALWRVELRNMMSKDPVFVRDDNLVKSNTCITTSLCIHF
ncbi:MAG: porin [Bacteroidota bacterium]